jgi:hypothetical protein
MPQSASIKGATKSTGWPQSAKNDICPHSCNIMPLVATNFSTTLFLQVRHRFITPQGWNPGFRYWRSSGLWDLLAKWWPLCTEFIKLRCW